MKSGESFWSYLSCKCDSLKAPLIAWRRKTSRSFCVNNTTSPDLFLFCYIRDVTITTVFYFRTTEGNNSESSKRVIKVIVFTIPKKSIWRKLETTLKGEQEHDCWALISLGLNIYCQPMAEWGPLNDLILGQSYDDGVLSWRPGNVEQNRKILNCAIKPSNSPTQ